MSAAPQISWDEEPTTSPQIQWDEEEKKQPEKKSFFQRARDVMPEGLIRRGLEKGSEWAGRKQEETYGEGLKAAARGEPAKSTLPGAGYGMLSSAMKYASHAIQPTAGETAATGAMVLAPEIAGPAMVAHGLATGIKEAPAAFKGDPEAAEKALLAGSEAAAGGAMGAGALARNAPRTFTGNALSAAKRTLIKGEPPNALVPEAQKAFTQAIQPGVNIPRAQESIQIAGPRMKQVMEDQGMNLKRETGPEAVPVTKKALDVIRASKQAVHAAIEDRLGPVAELQPDTSPVADAMERTISGRTLRQFPKDAEAIQKRADTYRGNLSLREIENSIQDANNELRNYYKRPGGTDSPTAAHMDATLAEVKTLRNLLDEKVESLSGAGVKDLKREYGALRDVERATAKQHAIATRTKEGGLWEGLSYLHAAGDLLSGNALGAARAGGAITVGRMLKNLRNPDFLIEQSFHGPKAFEAAEPITAHTGPPAPKGLLPAPRPPIQGEIVEEPPQPRPRPVPSAAYQPPQLTEFAGREPSAPPPARTMEETTLPPDETRLGPTGRGGVRIPIKGLLQGAREGMAPPAEGTSVEVPDRTEFFNRAAKSAQRGFRLPSALTKDIRTGPYADAMARLQQIPTHLRRSISLESLGFPKGSILLDDGRVRIP